MRAYIRSNDEVTLKLNGKENYYKKRRDQKEKKLTSIKFYTRVYISQVAAIRSAIV